MTASHIPERNRAGGGRLEKVTGSLLVRRFSVRQPEMYRVIESVSAQKLTSIDKAALCELAQTAMDIEYEGLEGDFLEASFGQTGAATVMDHAKRRNRPLLVHDLQSLSVPYEEIARDGALALAHLDCGQYEAMRVLLERLAPRLVPGGQLIIDDYKKEGCRKAVDEYFLGKTGFRLVRKSRLHIIRN